MGRVRVRVRHGVRIIMKLQCALEVECGFSLMGHVRIRLTVMVLCG